MTAMTRILVGALAALALGASIAAWHEHQAVQELRADGATPEERARLQKAAWDNAKKVHELQAQLSSRAAASAGVALARASDRAGGDNRTLGDAAAEWLNRMDDPEIRRLMDLQQTANIRRQYSAFIKSAHLTTDQTAQFTRLMIERQNAANDVLIAATHQGMNPLQDPEEFRQIVRDAQNAVDGQIQSALGADSYSQFQSFQQAQGQLGVVNQLQQDLSLTETPLTDAQRSQMAQIMSQTNANGGSSITDDTLAKAQAILTPAQMQALQNLQQLQQANRQLRQLMSQGRGASAPQAANTPGN
jgi:hypothetical protein